MALEDALNNLALAIREHASVLAQTIGAPTPVEAPKETKKVKETTPTQSGESSKTPAETEVPSTSPKEEPSDTSTTQAASTDEPANISETFFEKANELIQLDVEKAKIVLTELGFAKFKLVPANKHALGLKLVEAQLNG